MLDQGSIVHIGIDSAPAGTPLVAGVVTEIQGQMFTAEFADPISPVAGAKVSVGYHINGKFHKVSGQVQAFLQSNPTAIVRFHFIGEPLPSEGREVMRVPLVAAGLTVQVGDERECPLQDTSGDGLGVLCAKEYKIDSMVTVTVRTDEGLRTGRTKVCNVKALPDGRFRYGLQPLKTEFRLRQGLQWIGGMVLRQRLRRMAHRA